MTRALASVRAGVSAALALGVVQVLLETLAIAFLYSDFILAPRTFFNVKLYDAFAKLHAAAAEAAGLTVSSHGFIAVGLSSKLALLPELLAINLFVALLVGTAAGLLAVPMAGLEPARAARRIVVGLVALELIVHVGLWAAGIQFPVEPTFNEALRNAARNFLFDGTALAVVVTVVALVPAALAAPRLAETRAAFAIACLLAVGGGLWLSARSPVLQGEARSAAEVGADARDYNVVLISIDSLRSDHLSAYGYPRDTSPTLATLARDGVLCANNSSTTAWTLPGHMSILTGRTLLGHGVVSDDRMLTDDVPTLAESFQQAGYTTGAVVSAPYVESRYGFNRGFDTYDDRTIYFATHGESYKNVTAPLVQKTAASWLSSNADRKFFLFLHYWDVHYDYNPGPPYDTMFDPDYDGDVDGENFYFSPSVNAHMDRRDLDHVIALYDGEIRLVDDQIGRLRETLAELGVADRTIIVVTSDHGDEFFEHGRKGHHRSLYDEILRVPLVIYVPGLEPLRPVLEMETSIVDIVPTVLSLVGIPIPAGVDGEDLSRIAYGDTPEWNRRTVAELYRIGSLNCQVSLRSSEEKLIHHFNRRLTERYRTEIDPTESDALAGNGALIEEMHDVLEELWPVYWSRVSREGVNALAMDPETEARLKALGYFE
jgi:arylsulfatase A-like enzyme